MSLEYKELRPELQVNTPVAEAFELIAEQADKTEPVLRISLIDGEIVLSWEGEGSLEVSGTATGPYLAIEDATSPHGETLQDGARYYRLRE